MAEDTTEATPADVLRDAANVLRRDGWCRGQMHSAVTGHHCAVGAIDVVTETDTTLTLDRKARKTLIRFLGLVDDNPATCPIPEWNDRTAIDGEHVAQTMEKAAAAWEEVAGLD